MKFPCRHPFLFFKLLMAAARVSRMRIPVPTRLQDLQLSVSILKR